MVIYLIIWLGKTIAHLVSCGLETVTLGHLSKENNFPELALNTVYEELAISNYSKNDVCISVAKSACLVKYLKLITLIYKF